MKNSITYFFLKSLSIFFLCFPRILCIKIAEKFGLLIYYIFPKRKDVATSNLNIAFPHKDKGEISKLLKNTYKHYTVLIVEFLRQRSINLNKIKIDMDEKTKELLLSENGQILMTAHMGNWEMTIPILSQFKKIAAVVKIQNNSGGDKFIQKNRQFDNTTLIPMRGSRKKMIESLLEGKILILASDQNAGDRGTKVSFFGKETSIPKGAAYFHYKTNCPIVVGFCILKEDYSYEFKLRPLNVIDDNDIKNICIDVNTKYSLLLEEEVKKYPEQYFWFHKKWG